jgi:hypothetical protein
MSNAQNKVAIAGVGYSMIGATNAVRTSRPLW